MSTQVTLRQVSTTWEVEGYGEVVVKFVQSSDEPDVKKYYFVLVFPPITPDIWTKGKPQEVTDGEYYDTVDEAAEAGAVLLITKQHEGC